MPTPWSRCKLVTGCTHRPHRDEHSAAACHPKAVREERLLADPGLEVDPASEQMRSGLEEARAARARPAGGPLGGAGLFGPEFMGRLAMDPKTRPLLAQPDFVSMVQDLGRNPSSMSKCARCAGPACLARFHHPCLERSQLRAFIIMSHSAVPSLLAVAAISTASSLCWSDDTGLCLGLTWRVTAALRASAYKDCT